MHFAQLFQKLHAKPTGWLDLFGDLSAARSGLPDDSFQLKILVRGNESRIDSVSRSLREAFDPFSMEVAMACGDRFLGGRWPAKMSAGASFFARVMLSVAMRTVASFAPTPDRPLTPTLVPFPDADLMQVALWFTTEWWLEYGHTLYELEVLNSAGGNPRG